MRIIPPIVVAAILSLAPSARAVTPEASDDGGAPAPEKTDAPEKGATPEATAKEDPAEKPRPPGELLPALPPRKDPPRIEINGGAYFWYYQPLSITAEASPDDGYVELYLAGLDFHGRLDDFGLLFTTRFRDSKVRAFYMSNVWIQEAYAYYERPYLSVKVGKVLSEFSPLWDDSFYGSMPYFDGIKLDYNYGVSLDGRYEHDERFGLAYHAQYFMIDGGTNGSLRDRDTVWVNQTFACDPTAGGSNTCDPNAKAVHRNHTLMARIDPSYRINSDASVRAGLAAQYMHVNFPAFTGVEPQNVYRIAGDVSLVYGPVRAFGEFIAQFGKTVIDYPTPPTPATMTTPAVPGRSSGHNHYLVAGAEAQIWRLTARYSFSLVDYRDLDVTEWLHLPGVSMAVHENIAVMLEYAYWRRTDPTRSSTLDNSLNGVLHARF